MQIAKKVNILALTVTRKTVKEILKVRLKPSMFRSSAYKLLLVPVNETFRHLYPLKSSVISVVN